MAVAWRLVYDKIVMENENNTKKKTLSKPIDAIEVNIVKSKA